MGKSHSAWKRMGFCLYNLGEGIILFCFSSDLDIESSKSSLRRSIDYLLK